MSTMTPENSPGASTPGTPGEAAADVKYTETAVFVRPDTSPGAPYPAADTGMSPARVPKSLGKYQISGVLGQGGMAVVLKGLDPMLEREVAIKVLASHLAADPPARSRFLAEAKAAGKLNHPNVIAIHEICQESETFFLVLEYAPGGSLEDRLAQQGPLGLLEATNALIDACKGVGAAHAAGLIHRDIKPANFMRAADGSIKVADFGLAKALADTGQAITQTGVVVGTPYFMSPEQCDARPLDQRSDVYSLGATYYSLLTGLHPYHQTQGVAQLMYLHCHGPVPDPRSVSAAIPEVCARIIARAMAKTPSARYQSTGEMLADLQAVSAALSGQTRIDLPSQTGIIAAANTGTRSGLQATGEPVKVGVLHSLSGTMATSEAVVVDAVLFALDEVNQAGGVLGRPVQPVVADGRSDWSIFAREAERLLSREKVCTVFGCWTSASRKTVKPIFEAHNHLLIYPVQFEGLETSPCIIYAGAAPNQQILPAVQWSVTTLHKKRFFLAGSDYVFPRAAHAIIQDHLQRLRAHVVGEAYLPLGSQQVERVVHDLKRAKPDMILNTINGDSNIAFFRALRAAGIRPATIPTLSFSVGEQELRSLNPDDLVGDYAAWTYFQRLATPENEDFVARFHRKYPQRSITDPMETAYVAVRLWASAVNDAQSIDPRKIRRALLNQRLKAPDGEVRIDADTQYCSRTPRIGQIQADGQLQVIWAAPEPVAPIPYPESRTAEVWKVFLHDLYTGWGNHWAPSDSGPTPSPRKVPARAAGPARRDKAAKPASAKTAKAKRKQQ
jgi:urea transport system substrate-binding protein